MQLVVGCTYMYLFCKYSVVFVDFLIKSSLQKNLPIVEISEQYRTCIRKQPSSDKKLNPLESLYNTKSTTIHDVYVKWE